MVFLGNNSSINDMEPEEFYNQNQEGAIPIDSGSSLNEMNEKERISVYVSKFMGLIR